MILYFRAHDGFIASFTLLVIGGLALALTTINLPVLFAPDYAEVVAFTLCPLLGGLVVVGTLDGKAVDMERRAVRPLFAARAMMTTALAAVALLACLPAATMVGGDGPVETVQTLALTVAAGCVLSQYLSESARAVLLMSVGLVSINVFAGVSDDALFAPVVIGAAAPAPQGFVPLGLFLLAVGLYAARGPSGSERRRL